MTTSECYSCDQEANFERLPPRERVGYDDHWRIAHARDSALLGWLVLLPRRHVMEVAELTDAEAAALGHWQVRVARAFEAELSAAKSYVVEFGELPGYHLHFHLVPRLPGFDATQIGPKVFGFLGRPANEQVSATDQDRFATRLADRIKTSR